MKIRQCRKVPCTERMVGRISGRLFVAHLTLLALILCCISATNQAAAQSSNTEATERVKVRFHQSYGIRKNTPVFWRSERVGFVQDIRSDQAPDKAEETFVVTMSLRDMSDMPGQCAAVVAGVSEGKGAPGLRIELLPHPSSSVAGIVGYGSFEEFWLDSDRRSRPAEKRSSR